MKRLFSPRLRLYQLVLLSTTAAVGVDQAYAADSWFSRVRTAEPAQSGEMARAASLDSTTSIFDIVVSLHSDPQGDDDSTVDAGADDEEQRRYEEIVKFFADSVYEQSNGAHTLGKVRIFRNGRQANRADVVWTDNCHPSATPSGFGATGNINMCDVFGTVNFLNRPEDGGNTLGHEWGHYALGLFDEYRGNVADPPQGDYWPRSTDEPTDPSIMNNQWNAAGGNFEWLNHSTSNNIGDLTKTAQGRVFKKSGWDALVQSTDNDPNDPFTAFNTKRTRYTNLSPVAPADPNFVVEQLPGERDNARENLDIIWMADDIELQIVFDKSGSMGGAPIVNARTAANTLVDVVEGDHTAVGVVTFDSNVSQIVPITPIPDPGVAERNAIKSAISGIPAGGLTAMFDGLNVALANLQAFAAANNTSAGQVSFLLSDGGDNASSTNQAQIEAAYRAADVPIIAFGYGSGAPGGVLASLAAATGGQFFSAPTTLAEIQAAFLAANTAVSSTVAPSSGLASVPAGTTESVEFPIDSTIAQMVLSVSFVGSPGDVDLELLGPGGGSTSVSFDCQQSAAETSCLANVDEATLQALGTGLYTLVITNNTGDDRNVTHFVSASPKDGFTYNVTLANMGGQTIDYPAPMVLGARVTQAYPIAGLQVTATITTPSGAEIVLDMNDEGRDGDIIAGDGTYSALFSYTENGTHSIDVSVDNGAGTGEFTEAAFLKSVLPDGSEAPPQDFPAITENFARTAGLQVEAQGVVADDHPNDPTGVCTAIEADNSDTAGKIETPGDVDCFSIAVVDVTKELVVRVDGLAFDMQPDVTVFRSDGTTEIASGTVDTAPNGRGALALPIPATDLDPAGVVITVKHEDDTAEGGTYNVSAGDAIPSDEPPVPADDDPVDEPAPPRTTTGGGAIGPVTLLFLTVLGGLGILRRRFALLRR